MIYGKICLFILSKPLFRFALECSLWT